MLLQEFFGRSLNLTDSKTEKDKGLDKDDFFWFFLDHDKLHKDYAIPLTDKMRSACEKGKDSDFLVDRFMEMVDRGCMEYYKKKKMQGNPKKLFSEEMKKDLCQRLYDHYYETVTKELQDDQNK